MNYVKSVDDTTRGFVPASPRSMGWLQLAVADGVQAYGAFVAYGEDEVTAVEGKERHNTDSVVDDTVDFDLLAQVH